MTRAGITLVIEVEGKKDPNGLGFGLGRLLIRDANVGKSRIGWHPSVIGSCDTFCHSAGTAGMIAGGCEDSGAQVKLCPVRCFNALPVTFKAELDLFPELTPPCSILLCHRKWEEGKGNTGSSSAHALLPLDSCRPSHGLQSFSTVLQPFRARFLLPTNLGIGGD